MRGYEGTRKWSKKERKELIESGRVKDYDGYAMEGHHINSVNANVGQAGNPDNIEFLTKEEHKQLHSANGGTKVPTECELKERSKFGQPGPDVPELPKSFGEKRMKARQEFDEKMIESGAALLGGVGAVMEFIDQFDLIDPTNSRSAY